MYIKNENEEFLLCLTGNLTLSRPTTENRGVAVSMKLTCHFDQ